MATNTRLKNEFTEDEIRLLNYVYLSWGIFSTPALDSGGIGRHLGYYCRIWERLFTPERPLRSLSVIPVTWAGQHQKIMYALRKWPRPDFWIRDFIFQHYLQEFPQTVCIVWKRLSLLAWRWHGKTVQVSHIYIKRPTAQASHGNEANCPCIVVIQPLTAMRARELGSFTNAMPKDFATSRETVQENSFTDSFLWFFIPLQEKLSEKTALQIASYNVWFHFKTALCSTVIKIRRLCFFHNKVVFGNQ